MSCSAAIQICRRIVATAGQGKAMCSPHPAGRVLAALTLLTLAAPHVQSGFQAPQSFDTGSVPVFVAVGDFNGDGFADLAVVYGGGVRVLLGDGDGTFRSSAISYLAGIGPASLAVGDFNGDGLPDLAVTNFDEDGSLSILLNDGKWAP